MEGKRKKFPKKIVVCQNFSQCSARGQIFCVCQNFPNVPIPPLLLHLNMILNLIGDMLRKLPFCAQKRSFKAICIWSASPFLSFLFQDQLQNIVFSSGYLNEKLIYL